MRLLALGVWVLGLSAVLGFGPPTFGEADPFSPSFGSSELRALREAPGVPAAVRAVGAVVVEADRGHALVARNADARLAPASLTKMMTALVALDHASLPDTIRATERSLSEPAIIGLDPGDTLSLNEMLYGMLLPSGNDAALAIAESVGGGSIERFVQWMNERAAAMGLGNTHFANPTGLDELAHYSSARDMAEIARAFLANPTLAEIVATPRYVVRGPPLYLFLSSNPLLGGYPGLDGVKTGFTDDAGRCYVASATRDGDRIIVVLLNSPDIGREGRILLDSGFGLSQRVTIDARPGFSSVRQALNPGPEARSLTLAGWELPLMRAFGGQGTLAVELGGRTLARWTQ